MTEFQLMSVDGNFTVVRLHQATENFDERAFACTVLATERVNLTRCQLEADAGERLHATIVFGQIASAQQTLGGERLAACFRVLQHCLPPYADTLRSSAATGRCPSPSPCSYA